MTPENQIIVDKVQGRMYADEVNEYIIESLPDKSQEYVDAFWLKMLTYCCIPSNTEVNIKPTRPTMTDQEAKRFERKTITFGVHEGLSYRDVDTSYLLWVNGTAEELASYLRSDIGQRRQEEDASSD